MENAPENTVDMADFAYAWRFTDSRWELLPQHILDAILPLSLRRGLELCRQIDDLFLCPPYPPRIDPMTRCRIASEMTLKGEEDNDAARVRQWLQSLPLDKNKQAYISWGNGAVVITSLYIFIDYWDSFYYPFDTISVFDETLNWAILLCQEEYAYFISKPES